MDRAAREVKADEVFLELLARFTKQNRYVSDKTGTSYAPALFASGKIWNEPCGKPSRPQYRIAVK